MSKEGELSNSSSAQPSESPSPNGGAAERGAKELESRKEGGSKPQPALKRGSACLHCRKRKLKCTGANPCPACVKGNHECTFDEPGKPRSRVKMLEEKIAGLESIITSQAPSSLYSVTNTSHPIREHQLNRASSTSFPYPPRVPKPSTRTDDQEAFSLALQELFGSDPNVYPSGNGLEQSGPTAFSFLQDPDLSTSSLPPLPPPPPRSSSQDFLLPTFGSTSLPLPTWTLNQTLEDFSRHIHHPPSSSTQQQPSPSIPGSVFPDTARAAGVADNRIPVPDDWRDGTILPEGMRDTLLGLFFERRRQFGLVLHVGRFFGSLDGPPEARPAGALLFAMYTCACRFSTNPDIRALEDTFFLLAKRHIDIGVATYVDQRLVQVVQASSILAAYIYSNPDSKSRYLEGWLQGGASMRLAQGCLLHRISPMDITSLMAFFAEGLPPLETNYKASWPSSALPAPKDGIELGERIHAFWSAFTVDQLGAVATGRSGSSLVEIETPFPRPLADYERGIIIESEMRSISNLFEESTTRRATDSLGGIFLESMVLLVHSSSLSNPFIQPSLRADYLARPRPTRPQRSTSSILSTSNSFSLGLSVDSPFLGPSPSESPPPVAKPLPAEFLRLEKALVSLVSNLPPQFRDPSRNQLGGIPPWTRDIGLAADQGDYDGPSSLNVKMGINPVLFCLHVMLCTSFLLMYAEASKIDPAYRAKAVAAASSAVQLIQIVVDVDFGQLDIILVVLWLFQSRILVEGIKSLRRQGKTDRAAALSVEIEVLVLAMKRMGQVWSFGEDIGEAITLRMEALAVNGDEAYPETIHPTSRAS
ncbi:hypothetical protein BDY24DRAFT_387702 [Mrakia frigida]|uniref:Zn(II)2Cys6 transcription factor n=1 Tax=Mrakia frigida TaxID=29902 RepID=UPI003FCC0320